MATSTRSAGLSLLFVSNLLLGRCINPLTDGNSDFGNYIYEVQNGSGTTFVSTSFEAATAVTIEEALKNARTSDLEIWDVLDDDPQHAEMPNSLFAIPSSSKPSLWKSMSVSTPETYHPTKKHSPQPPMLHPPKPTQPPNSAVSEVLDALLDFALAAVRYEMVANHSTEEPVPDFKQQFHVRVGPFKVHGHLDASQGTVGDLSSLYRDGHVSLTKEAEGVFVLNAAVGLRTLRVQYRHYSARAGPIRVSGNLEADASPAALAAQLEFHLPCSVRLRALRVSALGPLHVRASGLGVLRRLLPHIAERMRGEIESNVVERLSAIVQERLRRFSC